MDKKTAESIGRHVEALLVARTAGVSVRQETAAWLASIGDTLRDRLARAGLIDANPIRTVADLIAAWLAVRSKGLTKGTLVRMAQSQRSLVGFFGPDRAIHTIHEGDAEDFRSALLAEGLAETTVRKRCSEARSWFRYAVRHR